MSAAAIWQGREVVVCVGTGGVGKTTVAAALAMAAAKGGRRVLVMTIDPARRLAQSLGIDAKEGQARPIAVPGLVGEGSLSALILDVQATFDALIAERAKDAAQAETIRQNRIYQHFSASLAGSHEYAAVERLWDAVHDQRYDLVVLDTPPAQNALDFLGAPRRILDFLEGQTLTRKLPGASLARRLGQRLFDLGGTLFKSNVAKIAGGETLDEVLAFLRALTDMYDSFCQRAHDIEALLTSAACRFVLVGSTGAGQAAAIERFESDLAGFRIEPAAYVLNRLTRMPLAPEGEAGLAAAAAPEAWQNLAASHAAKLLAGQPGEVQRAVAAAIAEEGITAARDAGLLAERMRRARGRPVLALYEQSGDVDHPAAIAHLANALLGDTIARST